MADDDRLIRNGRVATAADSFDRDSGSRDGRIRTLGERPGSAERELDAGGK